MRKAFAVILSLVVVGATLVASFGGVSNLLERFERLHVAAVEIQGARYFSPAEIHRIIPAFEDDRGGARALERRLSAYELVESAMVRVRPGDTVEITIHERQPVAFVATPALEPVDGRGQVLPIDPTLHRLDLPILRTVEVPVAPARPSAEEQIATMAGAIHRLGELDPGFARSISELSCGPHGAVTARFTELEAALRFKPPLTERHLRQGIAALSDAISRAPERVFTVADLRFADQVVVKHTPISQSRSGSL